MTRPTYRRPLRLESLEKREVLNGPTADQQYMLEMLNAVRTNPGQAAELLTSNLTPDVVATLNHYGVNLQQVVNQISGMSAQPPLAWNDQLAQAAQGHSQDEANTGVQSHTGSDGSDLNARLDQAGYTNRASSTENTFAYATSLKEAMQAFLLDWGVASQGHLDNIMEPGTPAAQARRDVGIGIVNANMPNFGPAQVVTQDFGAQNNEKPELLGVAFNDKNGDNFYEPGEGQSGVTIKVANESTGQTATTQTMDAGGYQIPLAPGTYKVTALLNGQVIRSQDVTINNVNVKVDYNLSQPWQGGSAPTVTPAAQTLSAPTPAPSPVSASAPTHAPSNVLSNNAPANVTVPQPGNQSSNSSDISALFAHLGFVSWRVQ